MPAVSQVHRLGAGLAAWAGRAFSLDPRSLALYRVGLGGLLVADCLLRGRDFSLMLAPDGILPPDLVRRSFADAGHWSLALIRDAAWWNGTVLGLEGLAGVLLVCGIRPRLATIIGWVAVVSLIRRTATATNAGDLWLACQLLWASFLPLGSRWSLDGRRGTGGFPPAAVLSVATAALVLQLGAVYLGAGLAKCNAGWFTGVALQRSLSVHDHGTPLGETIGAIPWLVTPLQWAVPLVELAVPLVLLGRPSPRARLALVVLGISFHVGVGCIMSLGLFPAVGIVAWLPLIPAAAWPASTRGASERVAGLGLGPSCGCGFVAALAGAAFVWHSILGASEPLPRPLDALVSLACVPQQWRMFGTVRDRIQWVTCRATLADGRVVDPLRAGRPAVAGPPEGGFTSLPSHRWHRFLWRLPEPAARRFGSPAAAAIARHWNARHGPEAQAVTVELRVGWTEVTSGEDTLREALIASWPLRSPTGNGGLDRFLDEHRPER